MKREYEVAWHSKLKKNQNRQNHGIRRARCIYEKQSSLFIKSKRGMKVKPQNNLTFQNNEKETVPGKKIQ